MPKKKSGQKGTDVVLGIRLPLDLIKALDEQAERMSGERPGIKISRSDVIRMLLLEGITRHGSSGK